MNRYLISNTALGFGLGYYKGSNELEAYRAMLIEGGFSETCLMQGMNWNRIPDHISVTKTPGRK